MTERPAAKAKTTTSPWWNGAGDQLGEEGVAGEHVPAGRRERGQRAAGGQQVLNRVDAEQGGEQRGHRRQGAHVVGHALGHAVLAQPAGQRRRERARSARRS